LIEQSLLKLKHMLGGFVTEIDCQYKQILLLIFLLSYVYLQSYNN